MPPVQVILLNLGTPAQPDTRSVRQFLKQFLSDPRVVEVPRLLWWLILRLFVLTFRPVRVARLYQSIWTAQGSPMRVILERQVAALQARYPLQIIRVGHAMTYGDPVLADVLNEQMRQGVSRIVLLPLYPQYSASTTAPILDQLADWFKRQRNLPQVRYVRDYHTHPAYIEALAVSVEAFWQEHGRADRLLLSFHGIPQDYYRKGDPYPDECTETAKQLAERLGLEKNAWAMSYQSRFGAQVWMQPYTDRLLEEWGRGGVASVQVLCPGFSADCLETLEEIAEQNREVFLEHGGTFYHYIPALNDRAEHIDLLKALVDHEIAGWIET